MSTMCFQGVSTEFDEAEGTLESVDEDLQTHLDDVKSRLKSNRSICYVSLNKDSHVLEIPEVVRVILCALAMLVRPKCDLQILYQGVVSTKAAVVTGHSCNWTALHWTNPNGMQRSAVNRPTLLSQHFYSTCSFLGQSLCS